MYRGLPASGKTTLALAWVNADPGDRVRLNRDTARIMLHGRRLGTRVQEEQVTELLHPAVRSFLRRETSVACDDTNLDPDQAQDLVDMAGWAGARIEVVDLTHVPLDICLERNAERPPHEKVKEVDIHAMYDRYIAPLAGRGLPLLVPQPF